MGENETIEELYARRSICRVCIQVVSEVDPSDPRREDALAEYNRQLASIDARIAAIEGKPPPVVIALKPAVLFAKSGGINHE